MAQVKFEALDTVSQVTPDGAVTAPRVNPAGQVSERLTPVAVEGPPFETTMVYVCVVPSPATTEVLPSSLLTETSAEVLTAVVSVSLSSPGSGSAVPVVATVAVFDTLGPVNDGSTFTT